jgi:hypothetical protein
MNNSNSYLFISLTEKKQNLIPTIINNQFLFLTDFKSIHFSHLSIQSTIFFSKNFIFNHPSHSLNQYVSEQTVEHIFTSYTCCRMLVILVCGIRKAIFDVQKEMCQLKKCQEKKRENFFFSFQFF